jgi:hypothetical protein
MPRVYLTRRRGLLFHKWRACPVCIAAHPLPHGGPAFHQRGVTAADRRPRGWFHRARAYHHPNPLRSSVTIWRCRRHARLRFVPLDAKQGLGGGVYR